MLLIAGGALDPNIACLAKAAENLGLRFRTLLVGPRDAPSIAWDINKDALLVDGCRLSVGSAFIRYDVFSQLDDQRPEVAHRALAWYLAMSSYLECHAEIRTFNRRHDGGGKPAQLAIASSVGLEIPHTWICNDFPYLRTKAHRLELVVKPVNGGEYCQTLKAVAGSTERRNGVASAPAIVQELLVQPDVRIYRVGRDFFGFTIRSDVLDYRTTNSAQLEFLPSIDPRIKQGLKRLTDRLGLDFAAADFKADDKGALKFLEVNSAPMFAAFDSVANGRVSQAILANLN